MSTLDELRSEAASHLGIEKVEEIEHGVLIFGSKHAKLISKITMFNLEELIATNNDVHRMAKLLLDMVAAALYTGYTIAKEEKEEKGS